MSGMKILRIVILIFLLDLNKFLAYYNLLELSVNFQKYWVKNDMKTIELRNNIHNLIDKIDNNNILIRFYELLQKRVDSKDGQFWNRLTEKEQKELLLAETEANDKNNLIDSDELFEKHKKWL